MAFTALRALRQHNYRVFFMGQLISQIGTWMQNVAQSWLVYRLTGSPLELGLVGMMQQLPILLLGPVAGAVADAFPRRRILVATQTASLVLAALLAALTLGGHIAVWHVQLVAGLLGIINAFDTPARHAFVAELVSHADLPNAIALNSSLFNAARMVGPALAAILVTAVGEGVCFAVNAASYIAVLLGLSRVRLTPRAPRPAPRTGQRLLEGFRFARRTPPLPAVFLLLAISSIFGTPYLMLMPVFADRVLHAGPAGLGMLMACAGTGALAGALLLAARSAVAERSVAVACAGFGFSLLAFATSRLFLLSAALLVVAGFALMVQVALSSTLVQSRVPDHLRGRVMAIHTMMFLGVAPIGAVLAGAAATRFGAPVTVAMGGLACVTAAGIFLRRSVRARAAGADSPPAQNPAASAATSPGGSARS
jgi:MFS family permease